MPAEGEVLPHDACIPDEEAKLLEEEEELLPNKKP